MSNGQAAVNAMIGLVPVVATVKVIEHIDTKMAPRRKRTQPSIGLFSAAKKL